MDLFVRNGMSALPRPPFESVSALGNTRSPAIGHRCRHRQACVGHTESSDGGAVRGEVGVEALARRPPRHTLRHLRPEAIAVETFGGVGRKQFAGGRTGAGAKETLRIIDQQ